MKKLLLQEDIKIIEAKIKDFENKTGCELLTVVAKESDPYPGAALRFGILSGFIISLFFTHYFEFTHHTLYAVGFLFITIFMSWLGHFDCIKKFALSDKEVERETFEKALESFYSLGSSKVNHKVTAMIMVSLLEHKIHVLIDEKLKEKISPEDLDHLISTMSLHFKDGNMTQGFLQSINELEVKILDSFKGRVSSANVDELKNTIHFLEF